MAACPLKTGLYVLVLAAPALAQAADLAGTFQGRLGMVEVAAKDGRVVGRVVSGGPCQFATDRRVLDATFEGEVLVGTVLVCQEGEGCPAEKSYPLFALGTDESALIADVRLDPGCTSPALDGSRLALFREEGGRPREVRGRAPSNKAELGRKALEQGHAALKRYRYPQAAQAFEIGLSYDESNWLGYLGLGITHLRREQPYQAVAAFERARELATLAKADDPSIHFNLACGYSQLGDTRAALVSLRRAVDLGFGLSDAMVAEPSLKRLHPNREFQALVKRAAQQPGRPAQARSGVEKER